MKQSSTIVFSVFVFLLALFLFQTIFQAFFIVLIFLVGSTLFEIFWGFCQSPPSSSVLRLTIRLFLSAALAISFYSLLFLSVEFLITEIWFKIARLPDLIGISILISLILFFSLVKWQNLFNTRNRYFLLLLFLFLSGLFYLWYRKQKLGREYLPKIYKISPDWGIQGQIIRIEGVNFGLTFKKGIVVVGREEMTIKFWNEKLVVAEQQVSGNYRRDKLRVIRSDNIPSNGVPFEVRDPNMINN